MKPSHAIVVGGTSGIGLEIVRQLHSTGAHVGVVGRDFSALEGFDSQPVLTVKHDLQRTEEAGPLFESIITQLGGLDLFIYCAGVLNPVEITEFNSAKDLEMIAVNVTGAVVWMNKAADHFQKSRNGCLMAIGSVAGDRGRIGQPVYNASKAFLHTYTESLRNRLARLGVSVVTVKPGPTRTPMTSYHDQSRMMDPVIAARKILKLYGKQGEFYLSPVHALVGFVFRHMPGWLMRRIRV